MRTKFFYFVLFLLCLGGVMPASAAFKDIKIDLTNGNLLTEEEISGKSMVSFGVVVGDDGSATRVAADDATANIVLNGKYHSDEHGWGNFSATVAVEGPVKVSMGSCAWGGDVTVKNAAGDIVAKFNTNNGACYHQDKEANIVSAYYKGTEATTLTISGGSYTPYIAVEAADPSELVEEATVTFSLGDVQAEGDLLPEAKKVEIGKTVAIPANHTLYIAGKTLTGWTDGTNTYAAGEELTVSEDVTLTPVFTDNTVSLADRTDAVTLNFDFQTKNGAPTMAYQNKTGIYVTQAVVNGQTIDVKLDFDTNNGGKIANANWNDWCQMTSGTKLTVPSCKGAVVSVEGFEILGEPSKTNLDKSVLKIDGQTDYTSGNVVSYTIANTAETIDVLIGAEGSYYRYVKIVLPVVQSAGGKTYTNEPVTVTWAMTDQNNPGAYTTTLDDAISIVSFDPGVTTINSKKPVANITDGNAQKVTTGLNYSAGTGPDDVLTWSLKPTSGLTFTPTRLAGYVNRDGTDKENGITVSAKMGDGTVLKLGTWTAFRSGKTPADTKKPYDATAIYQYNIELTAEQQATLTGAETFYLTSTVGVGTGKSGVFGEVTVSGTVTGTVENIAKYTLATKANPETGGSVSVYPKADEYEDGSEVTLTATPNFGYHFVNWTDAAGSEVSAEAKFKYTVNANAELTANFVAVNTYELVYNVTGGANLYMVQPTPAPTVVDGKNMYEEGTKVTLKASSNPIMTFTNWSNGETAAEMAVTMDGNKNITASYSAVDFIAAWDFYLRGNDGRAADFAAADNDAASLVMRNAEGATSGWLDKSEEAAGGYEGRPAAVNWRTTGLGEYYWQTMVNAAAFTDIKVKSAMAYNYNAYTKYNVEYSLDGEKWTGIGAHVLEGAKNWNDGEFALPADANNKERLYIRWIADKESAVNGTESANDGIAIAGIYITGTEKPYDDGKAPELVSSVPVNNGTGASANGKIVLTFNEKVKLTGNAKATIGTQELVPTVSGMTVICEYKGLDYSTDYTFTLAGNSVSDITDNVLADAIVINFQTKVKPVVEKKLYDFVVGVDGTITEALAAANSRGASATGRYRVFITKGNHVFDTNGTTTGKDGKTYDDPRSYLTAPYVSFIGESMEDVTITNKTPQVTAGECPLEGIGNGDVLIIQKGGHDAYFQGLTMKSSMGDAHGRDIVLNDQSNRTIFKDACLWAYQDTYVSNSDNGKFYFEGGVIRGRTDYLCGKGDVYYNEVTLQQCGTGGYLAVPSVAKKYGYVFNNCYIKKETSDVTFYLGRPWGSGTPIACFINTKMDGNAIGNGWADMSGGWPKRFAEYNSYLVSGTQIDLGGRRTSWKDKEGNEHPNDPILTVEDVNAMSLANVMGQDDDWDPTALTEQASAPTNVRYTSTTLTWDNSDYVLGWVVLKNGEYVANVIEPTYTIDDATATWSVRAANEMGGLGEATVATVATGIDEINGAGNENVAGTAYYNLQGIRVSKDYKGVVIKVDTMLDGRQVSTKIMK